MHLQRYWVRLCRGTYMLDAVMLSSRACLHSLGVLQAVQAANESLSLLLCLSGCSFPAPSSPIKLLKCMQNCGPGAACPRWRQQAGLQLPCWSQMPCTS